MDVREGGMKLDKSKLQNFRKSIRQFERLLSDQINYTRCHGEVTLAQCHAMMELENVKQTTVVDLAKKLGLNKSTISRTVEGLVKRGFVERKQDVDDRRFVQVKLTELGAQKCNIFNVDNDDYYQKVFKFIPAALHAEVIKCFSLLIDGMAEAEKISQVSTSDDS